MSWASDMASKALDALGIESLEDKIAAQTGNAAVDKQIVRAKAVEDVISNLAANTQGDGTYSALVPNADSGYHENLASMYTPTYGNWRSGSSNLPYDVAEKYGLGLSDRAHGPVIDLRTGYKHGYTVGGNKTPDDIAALFSGSGASDDVEYTDFDWDEEEDYLGDVMRDYERDYFGDHRDDSPMIYQCEKAGGTWVNGACVMPEDDPSDDGEKELDDFINSFDPFTSIKRAKWIHPLSGYDGTSNLWGYKPPQLDDWTPELRSWAAGE